MKKLNTKSCIECDEFDEIDHNDELIKIGDKLFDIENYDCIVHREYKDLAHKNIDRDIISDVSLWNMYDLAELVDCKNGADIFIDDDGFLNLSVYGQIYEYEGEHHFNNCVFKIMPHDEDMNLLDVSGYILKGEPVKLSKKQLKEKRKSTIGLLNEMKKKVKERQALMKEGKKKERGEER